ncbi:Multiple C2 and transmembrane domain-containing protein 1 [Collichthys lucidus]|uniref:Multiple C2 and transmembrane domain-containing protein 1 n=1 Tax=Collichthys lucidus TaxID=240159 RepID=A0A4U5UW45_COLLU|nr:Multiple C2 and transmembrane domain-containing protein 1 [Collichthys lucidus]
MTGKKRETEQKEEIDSTSSWGSKVARGADSAGYCQTDACHVPLPQIQNGERKAYVLKSKELTGPTKGVIFLEIDVIFNARRILFFISISPLTRRDDPCQRLAMMSSLAALEGLPSQGPRILQGQGVEPRLIDTDLLLKSSLIFYALFHGSYDSAYECVSFPIAHMVGIGDPVPVLASGGCAEKLVRAGGEIVRGEARSAREWDSSMCRGQKRIEKKTRGKRLSNYFKQHTKLKHCAEPSKGQHPERCGFPAVWGEGNAKGISAELTLKASAARGVCLGACCCCFVYTVTAAVAVCRFFCLNPELKPHRSNKQREIYIALAVLTLLSHDSIFSSARRFAVAFMNMELPFSPPPPAFSSSSTPASPLSSPLLANQSAKPQQLERLKPPHVSKRKSSRRMEGGRDGGMGEKRRRKYIFMFAGMSASASIPPAAVIGKSRQILSKQRALSAGTEQQYGGEKDLALMYHGILGLQSYTGSSFIGRGPLKHIVAVLCDLPLGAARLFSSLFSRGASFCVEDVRRHIDECIATGSLTVEVCARHIPRLSSLVVCFALVFFLQSATLCLFLPSYKHNIGFTFPALCFSPAS